MKGSSRSRSAAAQQSGSPSCLRITALVVAAACLGYLTSLAFGRASHARSQRAAEDGPGRLNRRASAVAAGDDDNAAEVDENDERSASRLADGGGAAASTLTHPPSTALARAFAKEAFRLEKIVQTPGSDEWRLCYPGRKLEAGEENPVCPTSSFFVVNQRDGVSDGVVDWLQGAEEHVMDLFSAILSTRLGNTCTLRPKDPHCFVAAGSFPAAARDKLMFLDIGSNHGFFAGYAAGAAPFLTAYAFEPQPQCAEFIELAVEASGFRDRVMVLNNLAGTAALATPPAGAPSGPSRVGRFLVPPASERFLPIPARTGCRGTWPTYLPEEEAAVRKQYGGFPGALDPLNVTYVDPGSLVAADAAVLLAKVDVEGFEEEVLDSLEPLIKRKRLFNILMELNKPQKLRRLGRDPSDLSDPVVVDWVIRMLKRLQGLGYTIVPQWGGYKTQQRLGTSDADLRALAESGWNSVDIWMYYPLGHDGHSEAVHDPAAAAAADPAEEGEEEEAPVRVKRSSKRKAKTAKHSKSKTTKHSKRSKAAAV